MLKTEMINRETPEKLYVQLYKILRRKIESGEWTVGTLIPTEREIGRMHEVSVITVKTAMSHLVNQGFLIRLQGKGTFVRDWRQPGNGNSKMYPRSLEGVLHEVNNPLAIIGEKAGLLSELIEEEKASMDHIKEYREALKDIKRQISRARKSTHGLTDLPQRIEAIKKSRNKGGKE